MLLKQMLITGLLLTLTACCSTQLAPVPQAKLPAIPKDLPAVGESLTEPILKDQLSKKRAQ
jgi:hypothetical protein